jgi:glucose-1-phosphate thymidylyltransferase
VGENSHITDSRITNSIIQKDATVSRAVLDNSMLGNFAIFEGSSLDLSVGDFNTIA